ncbi:hypothetical protein ACFQ7N_10110 [Streptomyces niveus]|uniref:hypothetical protein n=1 Tax=Streptomyces niveus TaxID=193462 RepID=UPI003680D88D
MTSSQIQPPLLWTQGKRPARWEIARLAVDAGDFLARYTRRPTPSDTPPTGGGLVVDGWLRANGTGGGLVVDGWLRADGWKPITPADGGARVISPVDPEAVARRLTSTTAPAGVRQILEKVVRMLHYPDDLPDGVTLAVAAAPHHLPDWWWGYVSGGWAATLTGTPGQILMVRMPEVPDSRDAYDLRDAMRWLHAQPELGTVRAAFATDDPEEAENALPDLRYDLPQAGDLHTRIVLGRLLYLYRRALVHRDQPVTDLVTTLRSRYGNAA